MQKEEPHDDDSQYMIALPAQQDIPPKGLFTGTSQGTPLG